MDSETSMMIHGGWNTISHSITDTYRFTPGRGIWTRLADGPPRAFGAACADESGEVAYLYGGINPDSTVSDELWRYITATDTWEPVNTSRADLLTPVELILTVSPNPFTDYTRVEGLVLPAVLYDISGRMIGEVYEGLLGRALSSGTYILRPSNGSAVRIIKR